MSDRDCNGRRKGRQPPYLLPFSGLVDANGEVPAYLANAGNNVTASSTRPVYPVATPQTFRSAAVNLVSSPLPPTVDSITVELLRNGVPVPGFAVVYLTGQNGIKYPSSIPDPAYFPRGSTFDVRVTTDGVVVDPLLLKISATYGVTAV